MNNPIQLLPTDLIAVEVPIDATSIYLSENDANLYILGEVTADSISNELDDYIRQDLKLDFDEFLSLLQANGLNWVNPIPEPKQEDYFYYENEKKIWDGCAYHKDLADFDKFESKLLKGKLIILKEIK
jgi:hypothetical protein